MQSESPYYRLAHDFALYTNRSIFLTGKAGTGKTTFLHNLKNETKKQMAVVAPTGVAAINAGGTTMHSFFQLPFTPFVPTAEGRKNLIEKMKMQSSRRKVLQELELLVIDEISMVRADVLDSVDTILRHVRYRHHEPFGGVQLIFIGDMFQLSPVATDEEWRLLSQYYASPYFFHSQVILQQQPVYIELDKIYRQTHQDFIQVLNEVRNNCLSEEGLQLLQKRYNPTFVPLADDTYITLTTHNYKADRINAEELAKLKGKIHYFDAEIRGDYPEKSYPTEKKLELKIGAKVMFIKNDMETPRRFFNGKIGVVEDIEDDSISIKCADDDATIELYRESWRNIRYSLNPVTKQIEEEELGEFIQYPLRLAWAITIHKSQGLTFDKAVIDAGDAFAAGQVYVALSRCRSIEGMVLLSKINPSTIQNDRKIVEHEKNKLPAEVLEAHLEESKYIYRNFVLMALFSFNGLEGQATQLLNDTSEHGKSFNEETLPYLQNVLNQTKQMHEVAARFQSQLQGILQNQPVQEDYLQERIDAASNFFIEKLDTLLETLHQSPVTSESRTHAMEYNDSIKVLFSNAAQKNFLLKKLKSTFSVEDYFIYKNTFIIPEFKVNAYAKIVKPLETNHPALYWELTRLRNQLAESGDREIPIYLVAGNKTLNEMSNFLPQNEKELLQIHGLGKAKAEKYGEAFLDVIREYSKKNNLTSQIDTKEKKTRVRKEKQPKGESQKATLQMFKDGKSLDEIATERGLAVSTIVTHLSQYIGSEINIDQLIPFEKRQKALLLLETRTDSSVPTYQVVGECLNQNEVKFFLAWLRKKNG